MGAQIERAIILIWQNDNNNKNNNESRLSRQLSALGLSIGRPATKSSLSRLALSSGELLKNAAAEPANCREWRSLECAMVPHECVSVLVCVFRSCFGWGAASMLASIFLVHH